MNYQFEDLEKLFIQNKSRLEEETWYNWRMGIQASLLQNLIKLSHAYCLSKRCRIEIRSNEKQVFSIQSFGDAIDLDSLLSKVTQWQGMHVPAYSNIENSGYLGVNATSKHFEIISVYRGKSRQLCFKNRLLESDNISNTAKEDGIYVSFCLKKESQLFQESLLTDMLKEYCYLRPNISYVYNGTIIEAPNGLLDFVSANSSDKLIFHLKDENLDVALAFSAESDHYITFINGNVENDNNYTLAAIRAGILNSINRHFGISLNEYELGYLVVASSIYVDDLNKKFHDSYNPYRFFYDAGINEKIVNCVQSKFSQFLRTNPAFTDQLQKQIDNHLEQRKCKRIYTINSEITIAVDIDNNKALLDIYHNGKMIKGANKIPLFYYPDKHDDEIDKIIRVLGRFINIHSLISFDLNDVIYTIKGEGRIAVLSGTSKTYRSIHLDAAFKDISEQAKCNTINIFHCRNVAIHLRYYANIDNDIFTNELNSLNDFRNKFSDETLTTWTIVPEQNYKSDKCFEVDILIAGL